MDTSPDISELAKSDTFHLGEDNEGGLRIRRNVRVSVFKDVRDLTEISALALALTERCVLLGKGKVFVYMQVNLSQSLPAETKTYEAFARRPNLLYLPMIWTPAEQSRWTEIEHADRLGLLNARCGFIPDSMPVLPIATEICFEEYHTFEIGAYSQAPVLLGVLPQAFLGYRNEMDLGPVKFMFVPPSRHEKKSDPSERSETDAEHEVGEASEAAAIGQGEHQNNRGYAFHEVSNPRAAEGSQDWVAFRMGNGDDIVKRLQEMCFEGKPGAMVDYGTIKRQICEAGRIGNEEGYPYAST
ncbi:MAG: hypothetical protein M1833_001940 [Piccolia ochrophora]|nr:MAG: hypothetical protein M1833_001940 [Piccolia ochrophora]